MTQFRLSFVKAHAYGNDFLYVQEADAAAHSGAALARALCDRHTGIGADGLILYEQAAGEVRMRLFNADGGRAEVSGNGVRGLAALLLRDDPRSDASIVIRTEGGVKRLRRTEQADQRQTFRADMGTAADLRQTTLEVAGELVHVVVLNIGNPQCVVLGELPGDEQFARYGRALERHAFFPDGTNVEFVHVENSGKLRIRIWERGVGPTTSSGTGSCAALVAAAAFGGAARDAEVIAPGGSQRVEWQGDGVYLTGWAEVICEGTWLLQIPRTSEHARS